MATCKVGVQLHPQGGTLEELRRAWRGADGLGVQSLWLWDHFFPLYGDRNRNHYEAYTLLAAMAVETERARLGALVTCNSYRNPNLLADMARTIHLLSGGRFVLGIGAGWFERDYQEYGYEFGTAPGRLRQLAAALPVIEQRLRALRPPAEGLPILVGGSGEKVTLRLVAEHAHLWNSFGPPDNFARKNAVLNDWCGRVGRDPEEIERTVAVRAEETERDTFIDEYVAAGAQHVIVMCPEPWDLSPVERALALAR